VSKVGFMTSGLMAAVYYCRWNKASLEGVVVDLCHQGTYDMEVTFYKGCGKGFHCAGGQFCVSDDVFNLSLLDAREREVGES